MIILNYTLAFALEPRKSMGNICQESRRVLDNNRFVESAASFHSASTSLLSAINLMSDFWQSLKRTSACQVTERMVDGSSLSLSHFATDSPSATLPCCRNLISYFDPNLNQG